jgi:hypothetical protein
MIYNTKDCTEVRFYSLDNNYDFSPGKKAWRSLKPEVFTKPKGWNDKVFG